MPIAGTSSTLPDEGMVLEKNQAYIFPLNESLNLPDDVYARANPKSSTGRLDVFTRLVTEYGTSFDEVKPGHSGKLFIEVVPRSFAIRVRAGDSLSQIRFQTGDPRLSRSELTALLDSEEILLDRDLRTLRSHEVPITSGMVLSVNLPMKGDTVGYQARRNTGPIDLRGVGAAKVRHFWNRIYGDNRPVVLEPDEFYIFASRELVRLPPMYCAEMVAFDASSGEVRTHYAGFFNSGFGYAQDGRPEAQRSLGRTRSAQPRRALPDRRRTAALPRPCPAQHRGARHALRFRNRLPLSVPAPAPEQTVQLHRRTATKKRRPPAPRAASTSPP